MNRELLLHLGSRRHELRDFILQLAEIETPSRDPTTQAAAFAVLAEALEDQGHEPSLLDGAGGVLWSRPADRDDGAPHQLLIGHIDTVWPVGTLADMPLGQDGDRLAGPGVYDMKGGLAAIVFALSAIRALGLAPAVTPEVIVNSDEEIGSRASTEHIVARSIGADRALVLEPSAGPEGHLKTGRKGIGRFTITIKGRAAHAGLDPEGGASAILELSHQIQQLFALNDPAHGVTVNVGTIDGGIGANVVAPESRAVVDVRVPSHAAAERIEAAIRALTPATEGVEVHVDGLFGRPPMEPTPASRRLWEVARQLGRDLGLELQEAFVGGASDGNTTSQHTPTLDGLGPVGGGAHAPDEHLWIDRLVERTALLAALILAPPLGAT